MPAPNMKRLVLEGGFQRWTQLRLLQDHKIRPFAGIEKDQQDRQDAYASKKDRHPQHPPVIFRYEAIYQGEGNSESDQTAGYEKNMRWEVRLVRSS